MDWTRWLDRLRGRRDRDEDAALELQNHLDLETEELRAAGLNREEAGYAARRTLGNTTLLREEIHAVWASTTFEQLLRDFGYAFRTFRRSPAFTLTALASLMLGIGANTVIFSVVNALLLRPLPFADAGRLVAIHDSFQQQGVPRGRACMADLLDWRSHVFQSVDGIATQTLTLTGEGEAEQLFGQSVTATFFQTLGVKPLLGRVFQAGDDQPGHPQIVLLSEQLWRRRFGASHTVVGRGINLNGRPFTVAGVMPRAFRYGPETEVWTPLVLNPPTRRGPFFIEGVARLKPGVTIERASALMQLLAQQIEHDNPNTYTRLSFPVVDLREDMVGDVRQLVWILSGTVLFVLVIAVSNVASLMLARASARRREIGVRLSIGAGRGHLIRQLMTESVLLALTGGALGVGLAYAALKAFRAAAPLGNLPLMEKIDVDASVCAFTCIVSLVSAIFFGLGPALSASSATPTESLRAGGRSGESRAVSRIRRALIAAQVALSMLLVVGAGLLVRSFRLLESVTPGFDAPSEQVLVMRISPSGPKYRPAPAPAGTTPPPNRPLAIYWDQLSERVRGLPGVQSVGLANTIPPNHVAFTDGFEIEGKPFPPGSQPPAVPPVWASPGYRDTLGARLLRGRWFDSRDHLDAPQVTVISDAMARQYFAGEDPIGQRLRHGNRSSNPLMEIVGVVSDVKYQGLQAEAGPVYYECSAQVPARPMWLLVRSRASDAMALAPAVRREIRALDANVPVEDVATMSQLLADSVSSARFRSRLMAVFAAAALLLAAMGIYGVIAYTVTQRRHEIGVRMALGSTGAGVVRLIVGQGFQLAVAGVALGLIGAFGLSRYMEGMLFSVKPKDPFVFGISAIILGLVAVAASLIPALRAARIDPIPALRQE